MEQYITTKSECSIVEITENQRQELRKIYELITSDDIESQILAFGLFKELFSQETYFEESDRIEFISCLVSLEEIKYHKSTDFIFGKCFIVGRKRLITIIINLLISGIYYISK